MNDGSRRSHNYGSRRSRKQWLLNLHYPILFQAIAATSFTLFSTRKLSQLSKTAVCLLKAKSGSCDLILPDLRWLALFS